MIVGLGALTVGGGAVFGSGAFSSTEANRELEVNVVTGDQISEDFVDILLNDVDGTDTVAVNEGTDPNTLFPDNSGDVSLMQNDVTIVFGPEDNELPPNSVVSYDDLLTIVNDDGDDPQDFTVTFSVDVEEGDGDAGLTFDPDSTTVVSDDEENVDVDVDTGSEEQTEGTLTIEIDEP